MYVGYPLGCTMSVACWVVAGWACYAIAWVAGWESERVAGAFGVVVDLLKNCQELCGVCCAAVGNHNRLWMVVCKRGMSVWHERGTDATAAVPRVPRHAIRGVAGGYQWRRSASLHDAPLLCAEFYLTHTTAYVWCIERPLAFRALADGMGAALLCACMCGGCEGIAAYHASAAAGWALSYGRRNDCCSVAAEVGWVRPMHLSAVWQSAWSGLALARRCRVIPVCRAMPFGVAEPRYSACWVRFGVSCMASCACWGRWDPLVSCCACWGHWDVRPTPLLGSSACCALPQVAPTSLVGSL